MTLALAVANNDCPTKAEALLPKSRCRRAELEGQGSQLGHGGSSGKRLGFQCYTDGVVSGRTAGARMAIAETKLRTGCWQEIRKRHAVRKLAAIVMDIGELAWLPAPQQPRNGIRRRHG